MRYLILILTIICICSCKREEDAIYDSNGVATKLPQVWNTAISDDKKQLASTVLRCPILFQNSKVLIGAIENSGLYMYALNPENGKVEWKWNDLLTYANQGLKVN
jgi:outer membrane protein assembly factor BamB